MKGHTHTAGPLRAKTFGAALCLLLLCPLQQAARQSTARVLLGVALGPEVSAWLNEVEGRLGEKVYAEFAELDSAEAEDDYTFGVSYLTGKGVAVLRVDESFRADARRAEAVIGHELLHLRLRVRGYPQFLFSPSVQTMKGPAEDVEQSNVNDLVSLIEHRIFADEMRRTGFERLIDLTNWLDTARRRGRSEDGQAETLNYARALLEWRDAKLLAELTRVYQANGWARSLDGGRRLADLIGASDIRTSAGVAPVFLRCMAVLYGAHFRLAPDRRFALSKIYPQLLIHSPRRR